MKSLLCALFLGMTLHTSLYSDIESITIRWVPMRCQGTCSQLLEKEFRKIQGINEISIDQGSGQATLTWKEKAPFQYTSINTAMHMVGISMRDIRLKIKGMIKHSGDAFFIVSEGDNTRFELMNPVVANPAGVANEYNAYARKLSPALKKQLLDGETKKLTATIEGPVFMPERMTVPTQIVVDQLNFIEPKDKK